MLLQCHRVHKWSGEQPCQSVSLAMSASFPPHWTWWNHTNVPDTLSCLEDVSRCEADVVQHRTGGDDRGDKGVVDLQSPEEQRSPPSLQHPKGPLYDRTGLSVMLVEAALHPPLQRFSIWSDDGHRSCYTGVTTITQYKVSCGEYEMTITILQLLY